MSNRTRKESGHSRPAEKPAQSGDRRPPRPGLGLPRKLWQSETNWSHRSEKKGQAGGSQSDKAGPPKSKAGDKHTRPLHGEKKDHETEGTRTDNAAPAKPGATEHHQLYRHGEKKGQEIGETKLDKTTPSKAGRPGKRHLFQHSRKDSLDQQPTHESSQRSDRLDPKERFERNRYFMLDKGVGRGFDQDKPAPGETDRYLASLPDNLRASLVDPKTVMTLYPMASRPGSENYNQALTERFGENLKREFEERGVRAQINIVATGEAVARQAQVDQANPGDKPPSDSDKADNVDEAKFRVAIIDIQSASDTNTSDTNMSKDAAQSALAAAADQSQPLTEAVKAAQEDVDDTLHKGLEISSLVVHTVAEVTEKEALGVVAPLIEWVGIVQGYSDAREANRRQGVITGIKLGLSATKNMTPEQLGKHIYAQDLGGIIRNQYWLKYVWDGELSNNPVADYTELGMIEGVDRAAEVINHVNRKVETELRRAIQDSGVPASQVDRLYQDNIQAARLQAIELIDKNVRDQLSKREEP